MFDLTALGWCRPGLRMDSTLCPVYMGTCAASLTAPSHIPVIQALPHEDHFLLPVRYQPLCVHMCVCVCIWGREGGRGSLPFSSTLADSSRLLACFPAHKAPPGSGYGHDWNTRPHLRVQTEGGASFIWEVISQCFCQNNWKYSCFIEPIYSLRLLSGKQITQRQSYSELLPNMLGTAHFSASEPITWVSWYLLAETIFPIGPQQQSFASSSQRGALVYVLG